MRTVTFWALKQVNLSCVFDEHLAGLIDVMQSIELIKGLWDNSPKHSDILLLTSRPPAVLRPDVSVVCNCHKKDLLMRENLHENKYWNYVCNSNADTNVDVFIGALL